VGHEARILEARHHAQDPGGDQRGRAGEEPLRDRSRGGSGCRISERPSAGAAHDTAGAAHERKSGRSVATPVSVGSPSSAFVTVPARASASTTREERGPGRKVLSAPGSEREVRLDAEAAHEEDRVVDDDPEEQ
jgi:hypothetical protein